MSRRRENRSIDTTPFVCDHCGHSVLPPEKGTRHRNHCPHCLHSKHIDMKIGNRRSGCRGIMAPIGIWVSGKKEWSIIHRCRKCCFIRTNRIAGDDNEMPLFSLTARPITQLPFPADMALEKIEKQPMNGET